MYISFSVVINNALAVTKALSLDYHHQLDCVSVLGLSSTHSAWVLLMMLEAGPVLQPRSHLFLRRLMRVTFVARQETFVLLILQGSLRYAPRPCVPERLD